MEPPSVYSAETLKPKWEEEKKWMGDPDNGVLPKWQEEKKWATKL